MMDAYGLKRRYMGKWARANAREHLVAHALIAYLPEAFEVRLTGLGAGRTDYIERSYASLEEAFDITVYYNGKPAAFLNVTGVADSTSARLAKCNGRCVGSWKLAKASKLGVTNRTWIAWVNDESASMYFLPLAWLEHYREAPFVAKCRFYEDERVVYCVPPQYRKRLRHFLAWLTQTAVYLARLRG